jgi:hypothetical protein
MVLHWEFSIVIKHLLTLKYRWPGGAGGSDLGTELISHQLSEYSGKSA